MKIADIFKDVLPLIEQYAPTVGAAIGGPFGLAAGYAIPVLAHAFSAKPTDVKSLVATMLSDPQAQNKLQDVESEHGDWINSLMENNNNLTKAEIHINLEWNQSSNTLK